jgi:hypothetical protein
MDVLVGIILLGLGAVVAFLGLRVFFLALPIIGFIAGMSLGLAIMHHLFDHQFLATSTGIIVGLVLGVIGAVVSYLFWYVGAVLAGAWLGAVIGAGLMRVFDVSPDSIWVAIAAIVGAIILAVITVALNLPIYMVIVNTAFTGAAWVVGGAMLIFDRLDRQELGYGTVWAAIDENWFWAIAWIIVAALGLGAQLTRLQEARLPEDPWTRAP